MEREELDSDGKPVPNTLVAVAPLNPPNGVWRSGQAPPPYPAAGDQAGQAQYLQWASANTPDILEPLFYTTVPNQGEAWGKPGVQLAAQQQFDPQQYLIGAIPAWVTPEQKQQIFQARQAEQRRKAEEQKQKVRSAPRTTPTRTPSGPGLEGDGAGSPGGRNYAPGGSGAARSYAAAAPVRAAPPTAPPPGTRPPPIYRPPPRPYGGEEGDGAGGFVGGGPGAVAPPNLPQPGTDFPTGEFDVHDPKWAAKVPPTIEAWAHDETAQPGKTYHYRLTYKIQNPIYGAFNVANNAALVQVFEIASKPSEWSSPVQIPTLVNFFVQSSKLQNANTVRFEVFKFEKGTQHAETFTVGPGDQIGGKKGEIDFSTDWTLVDFCADERQSGDTQILLMNKEGKITVRSFKADQGDPLYRGLKDQINALKAVEAAAAAATPGGAPPIVR
jgi:hypothetical protein